MIRRWILAGLLVLTGACLTAQFLLAANPKEMPAPPAASTYAPADDLTAQVDYYLHRTQETLAKQSEFDDASKSRLKKDANTLTALFLILGMHDTANRFQATAPALVKGSQVLAKAADYEAATAAFADLKKLAGGGATDGDVPPLKWQKVASLGQLMKQVPSVNSALKRGIASDDRFKELMQQSAGNSATLAAIAQTALADTHEVKNPADLPKWYYWCAEMRDAAGAVNVAVHAGNQAAATAAMTRLAKSCESCHEVFRKE